MQKEIKIRFQLDNSKDYREYPRFRETDYYVFSPKMHRVFSPTLPEFEVDVVFLPLYIFERQASRKSKRGWVNVNRRYWKIDGTETKEYGNYTKWYKELKEELDANAIENPITRKVIEFKYDKIPDIVLYQKFFSHEKELINRIVESYVRTNTEDLRSAVADVTYKIKVLVDIDLTWRREQLSGLEKLKELGNLDTEGIEFLSNTCDTPPKEVVAPIKKLSNKLRELRNKLSDRTKEELKDEYYGVLTDYRALSTSKTKMIEIIMEWMPKAKEIKYQLDELINLAVELIDISKINDRINQLQGEVSKLENELEQLKVEKEKLQEEYDAKKIEIERDVKEKIRKSIIFLV